MNADADVVVVGGGPAGLSAARVLGRCRRRVVLCDSGQYRNAAARAMHGFLTRDGSDPADVRGIGRAQLERYPSVTIRDDTVVDAVRCDDGFTVAVAAGGMPHPHLVLLATGVVDELPPVPGAAELYGRGVFHCPYCDGYEAAGRPLVACGSGRDGLAMALELRGWSNDVLLCTNGRAGLAPADRGRLAANGIGIDERSIAGSTATITSVRSCSPTAPPTTAPDCSCSPVSARARSSPSASGVSSPMTGRWRPASTRPPACRACTRRGRVAASPARHRRGRRRRQSGLGMNTALLRADLV